jgi:transcription elongation factor Elf1
MKQGNAKTTANVRPRRTSISTCIKCGGHKFEIALTQQTGSASRLSLVQCASCGTPTEVIDPDLPIRANWFERLIISIDNRLTALAKTMKDSN